MPPQQKTVQIPEEVEQELKMLRGFKDLVGERMGYFMGRRTKQSEMNDATKTERAAANKISKELQENLPDYIKDGDIDAYNTKITQLKKARKVVADKSKPFRAKIKPLAKAQKYCDTVAIPDALKELGAPVTPRFNLSDWINKAMQEEKN